MEICKDEPGWRPDDRLIPRLEPQPGRTHNLRHEARRAAELEPRFTGAFTPRSWVTSQSPAPDTTVYQGSTVEMHLSDHPRP